jgi:hypothetical protein
MNRWMLIPLALALAACGEEGFYALINAGSAPNQCSNANTRVALSGVELSDGSSLQGMPPTFAALADGASVRVVRGFQGADMFVLSIRVTGLAALSCIPHRTDVLDASGNRISFNAQPLLFDPVAGVATSPGLFFPGTYSPGSTVTIRTTVGSVTLTRSVQAVSS